MGGTLAPDRDGVSWCGWTAIPPENVRCTSGRDERTVDVDADEEGVAVHSEEGAQAAVILLDTNALLWIEQRHPRSRNLTSQGRLYLSPATLLEWQLLIESGRMRALPGITPAHVAADDRWIVSPDRGARTSARVQTRHLRRAGSQAAQPIGARRGLRTRRGILRRRGVPTPCARVVRGGASPGRTGSGTRARSCCARREWTQTRACRRCGSRNRCTAHRPA